MIADGVRQGYLEVRIAMAKKGGHLPVRPWRAPTRPRSSDWVAQLEVLAQHPRAAGMAPTIREPGTAPMSTAMLRERIAKERREAVERSRMH